MIAKKPKTTIGWRGWLDRDDKRLHPNEPANMELHVWAIDDAGDYQDSREATERDMRALGYVPVGQLLALATAINAVNAFVGSKSPESAKARKQAYDHARTLALRALEPVTHPEYVLRGEALHAQP